MKAALKFIMTAVGLLLIGLLLVVVLLLTQFDGLLREGLARQAGRILQCDVHLEGVRLDWSARAFVLNGVSLMNPAGYTDREAIRVEAVRVKPELLTLFSRTPVVARVSLREPRVHLQYKAGTGTNIGVLRSHAKAWSEKQASGEESVWGRRVLLREIRSGEMNVRVEGLTPPTPSVPLTIAPFTVEDPGGGAAISGARAMQFVLRGMLQHIARLDTLVEPVKELLRSEGRTTAELPGETRVGAALSNVAAR